jgi:hypothetical protein
MNLYDKASLIITPNAYKVSKMFSLKPTSGAGDFALARASNASRINSVGALESMANNVPRLNYPISGCPSWLFEPQRTNIFLNSLVPVTQSITVVNGSVYTVSISGGTATLSGAGTGSATTGSDRTFTASGTSLTVTISGSPAWCQVELGSYSTSIITTLGTSVTRISDVANLTGASALIGQTEGTMYWGGSTINGVGTDLMIIGTLANSVFIAINSSRQIQLGIRANSSLVVNLASSPIASTSNMKIAVGYKSGDIVVYCNGSAVLTSALTYTFSAAISEVEFGRSFYEAKALQNNSLGLLFSSRLTNSELAALTT